MSLNASVFPQLFSQLFPTPKYIGPLVKTYQALENHPHIHKIWMYSKVTGLMGLFHFALQLRKEKYTHVYDAHNNLRTRIIHLFLLGQNHLFIRRSLKRWKRFLLLRFHKNTLGFPRRGNEIS